MIRSILTVIILVAGLNSYAQSRTSSPYSFFGLGQQTFKGTIENRSMGGMSTYLDSVHVSLQNPASYANLRLTNFAIGGAQTQTFSTDGTTKESSRATTVEYMVLGIPLGQKSGFAFGLVPFRSVGYNLGETTATTYTRFIGQGDINRAFIGFGYKLTDDLSVGGEFRYNFGEESNSSSVALNTVQFGTNEVNETDYSGSSYNFSIHYQKIINSKYELQAALIYEPESDITARNNRTINLFTLNANQVEIPVDRTVFDETRQKQKLPGEITAGVTIGERLKWSIGAEYSMRNSSSLSTRSFAPANVTFKDAASYRVGGFFIPDYNSISSYWNRATYRAGLRYEETGLQLNNEDISEFGISFGIGLPIGSRLGFSNANVGLELGQRGSTNNGLIKENFVTISIGLSLNDKWFTQRKYY